MGAGAGVTVKTSDFTGCKKRGYDLVIGLGECTFGSYYWTMKCNRPGFIEVRDYPKQMGDLSWVDSIEGYSEGWPEKMSNLIGSVDWVNAEFSDGYESKLSFTIGGGYVRSCLNRGYKMTLDSPYYYNLNVHVTVPAVTRDGRRVRLSGYWYPYPMEFYASDLFVDMYEWCWNNEDGEFLVDMYDHEDFSSEDERIKFIQIMFNEGWNTTEDDFNSDDYYNEDGFVTSQCIKRNGKLLSKIKIGRRTKKRKTESWLLRHSSVSTKAICPHCGCDRCEKETNTIRRRGEYPEARKSVHLKCTECGYHWSTEATMKENRKVRLLGRK